MLARILVPAYMAQNFTAVCIVEEPSFLEQTAGPQGNAYVYAKHVKDEVSASLTDEEVRVVLRIAADTARSITRNELRNLDATTPSIEAESLHRWCAASAKQFVREVNAVHFEKHDEIERMLSRATSN